MSQDFKYILVEDIDNICKITINNPKTLNALNTETLKELNCIIDKIAQDNNIRVVIITGAGKSFVAGADISEMCNKNASEGKVFGELGAKVFRKIELLPKPVIAAVNGYALGGGCELALSCDIRIASEKARFGQPEVGLGITPGFSGTQRLPRVVGLGKAKELIYTGSAIKADEALKIGLVNNVVEQDQLLDTTLELAKKIASNAPLAISYAKEAINKGIETDIETGISIENNLFAMCFSTEDQKNGMKAFLNKEKTEFQGK